MRRCPVILVMVMLAGLALAGCSVGLPPDVAKLGCVNRADHFAMDVPAGWQVRNSTGSVPLIVTKPGPEDPGRPNVNVTVLAGGDEMPLESLVQLGRRGLAKVEGFKIVSEGDYEAAGAAKAWLLTFQTDVDGRPVTAEQLYLVGGGRAYLVTAAATSDQFAIEQANFDVCLRSFRAGW
jgi:hypothetical protein